MANPQKARTTQAVTRIDPDNEDKIYTIAKETGHSVTRLINGIIREALKNKSQEEIMQCLSLPIPKD